MKATKFFLEPREKLQFAVKKTSSEKERHEKRDPDAICKDLTIWQLKYELSNYLQH
jgi:hypothetical protein